VHVDQYDSCGDLAYLQGTVSLKTDGAAPTVVWFVTIWKRHADSVWRILADASTVVVRGLTASAVAGQAQRA
jgi:ketosteroid isomerase-like protein